MLLWQPYNFSTILKTRFIIVFKHVYLGETLNGITIYDLASIIL